MRKALASMVALLAILGGCTEAPSPPDSQASAQPSADQDTPTSADAADPASPEAVVSAYLEAASIGEAGRQLLSENSATMMGQRQASKAQMAVLVRTYRDCRAEPVLFDGDLAVIRYPRSETTCSPWFLVKEENTWRIDLVAAARHIRFGRGNAWHFDPTTLGENPYAFAFSDWDLDDNGYPR